MAAYISDEWLDSSLRGNDGLCGGAVIKHVNV